MVEGRVFKAKGNLATEGEEIWAMKSDLEQGIG